MAETKFTKGPLERCGEHRGGCSCGYIFGDGGNAYIAKVLSLDDGVDPVANDEMRKANAARIVLTWNCHDELVAALKELDRLSLVIESAVRTADPAYRDAIPAAYKLARAALAKARGEAG